MKVEPIYVESVLSACQRLLAIEGTTDTMVVMTGRLYEEFVKVGILQAEDFIGMTAGTPSAHIIKTYKVYDAYKIHFVQIVLDEPTAWVACIGINSKHFHSKMENNLYVLDFAQ